MAPFRMLKRVAIALLVMAVAALPVSGAHLHLCLDGAEPSTTVHAENDVPHHGAGVDQIHNDADVSLTGAALAKKLDGGLDLPGLIAAAFVLFRLDAPAPVVIPRAFTAPVAVASIFHLLPPLRGPPV